MDTYIIELKQEFFMLVSEVGQSQHCLAIKEVA